MHVKIMHPVLCAVLWLYDVATVCVAHSAVWLAHKTTKSLLSGILSAFGMSVNDLLHDLLPVQHVCWIHRRMQYCVYIHQR